MVAVIAVAFGQWACTDCQTGAACLNIDGFPYIALLDAEGEYLLLQDGPEGIENVRAERLSNPGRQLSVSRIVRQIPIEGTDSTRTEVTISIPNADLYVNNDETGRAGYVLTYERLGAINHDTAYIWVEDLSDDCCTDMRVVDFEYVTSKGSLPVNDLGQVKEVTLP